VGWLLQSAQLHLCNRSLNPHCNEEIDIQKMEDTYAVSKVAASLPSLHQTVPPSLCIPARRSLLGANSLCSRQRTLPLATHSSHVYYILITAQHHETPEFRTQRGGSSQPCK